jgi:predicted metal-dependent phosphoesterase TrpH
MATALNADLHSHSTRSDGTLDPATLARRAHANGVQLWALTDHDEVGGLAAAAVAAAECGLRFVAGVEISVSVAAQTVHIVGLGVDPDNVTLRDGLQQVRSGRELRARRMAAELEREAGVAGAYAGACRHAGNPALISRTHFARYLVEQRICSSTHEVFTRFLTPGKPGYVDHAWATLRDALTWIDAAGGHAVIAHPARYPFTSTEEWALFEGFKAMGGAAVEVVTASHGAAEMRKYAAIATEFGLRASRGSDFHSPNESRCDLGRLPPLPDGVAPVWDLFD